MEYKQSYEMLEVLKAFEETFFVDVYYYDYDKNGYDFRFVIDGNVKATKWRGEDLSKYLYNEYKFLLMNMDRKKACAKALLQPIVDFIENPPEDKHYNWVISDALNGLFGAFVKELK